MLKGVFLYRFLKLLLVITIPLLAGFFAFGNSFPISHLSTSAKNPSGVIMKPKGGLSISSFLTSVFDAPNQNATHPQNTIPGTYRPFMAGLLDALNKSDDAILNGTAQTGDQEPQTQSPIPKTEPARSLYEYFVASSAIDFGGNNPDTIKIALALAAKGQKEALNEVISEYERQLQALRAITPPSQAAAVHEHSLALIKQYILFLKNIAGSNSEDVLNLWNSGEHSKIAVESEGIIAEIKNIENTYNFYLPPDVLP